MPLLCPLQEQYQVCPFIINSPRPYANKYAEAAVLTIGRGQRRRFRAITYTELVVWTQEAGKGKGSGKGKGGDNEALAAEAVAAAYAAMDGGDDLPMDHCARLIKVKMVAQREAELEQRRLAAEARDAALEVYLTGRQAGEQDCRG